MDEQNTMRPFHCGSQYGDWTDANCRECVKGAGEEGGWPECDIEEALLMAYVREGRISLPIAERMGATEHKLHYGWRCGEFVAKE